VKSWEDVAPEEWAFDIRGKRYVVPELPYTAMLTVQKIKAGEATELDDAKPEDSWRLIMGSAWDEMAADNLPAEAMSRAGLATLAYFEQGRPVAEAIWENGIDPKALAAAIQERTEPQKQPNTESENPTRSRASMQTTSSRPNSSKKSSPKGKASAS
jgi:hypothetical protein